VLKIIEKHEDYLEIHYKVDESIYSNKSEYQQVDIIENQHFGKMLFLDGRVQSTERGYCEYHDTIAKNVDESKNILIIGGGDFFAAREILSNPITEKIDMVEIDEMVTISCSQYFGHVGNTIHNEKFNLKIGDGVEYVKDASDKYDAIVLDLCDHDKCNGFDSNFYADCVERLNDNGLMVIQAGSEVYEPEVGDDIVDLLLDSGFKDAYKVQYVSSIYPGGLYNFVIAKL